MSDPKQRYFIAEQGRTLKYWFRIRNPLTGTTYDLDAEGYTIGYLQVRDATFSDGGVILLDLSTFNGGVIFDYVADDGAGQSWSGYIYASATDMDTALWGDAVYEFVLTHGGGDVETVSRGPAMLIPKVAG
jgi:hypothetical protein